MGGPPDRRTNLGDFFLFACLCPTMCTGRRFGVELREKVIMKQRPIGPDNPGLSRFFAARFMVLLMASFYLAGAVLAVLYAFGTNPLR
jgi:hypothetical protein